MLSKLMAEAHKSAYAVWRFAADKPWSPDIRAAAKHTSTLQQDPAESKLS